MAKADSPFRRCSLLIKATYACNNSCPFCVYANRRRVRAIPYDRLVERIQAVAKDHKLDRVTVSGGEPALLPYFADLLAFLSRLRIPILVHTNGIIFHDASRADALGEHVDEVMVSLHAGTEDDLCRAYGVSTTSASRIFRGYANLRASIKSVITNTVVTKRNLSSLNRLAAYLKRHPPAAAMLTYPVPLGGFAALFEKEAVPIDSSLVGALRDFASAVSPVPVRLQLFPLCLLGPLRQYTIPEDTQIVIEPDTEAEQILDVAKSDAAETFLPIAKSEECGTCQQAAECIGFWRCYDSAGLYTREMSGAH